MATTRTETLRAPAALAVERDASIALGRAALWAMFAAKLLGAWGVRWDIQWHVRIGRDSFWIAPHVMTYAGVTLVVLLSFGVLAVETFRHRARPVRAPMVRMLGVVGTRGFLLAACGIGLTVLAAPIDDLWHRLFGLDVTLWSPPHLMGLAGSMVNTVGCFMIAAEVYPARSAGRLAATLVSAAMLYGSFQIVAQPGFLHAYYYGGLRFHLFAMLAAVLLPLALVPAARLTGLRAGPLVAALVSVAVSLTGEVVARTGFEMLQPVSVIQEEIVKDPTSPIAITHAIAQKNGERAGSTHPMVMLAGLLPVLLMVGVDARRRPVAAALGLALGTFVVFGWLMAHSPAYGPMAPGAATTGIAIVVAVVGGLLGGAGGRALAAVIAREA